MARRGAVALARREDADPGPCIGTIVVYSLLDSVRERPAIVAGVAEDGSLELSVFVSPSEGRSVTHSGALAWVPRARFAERDGQGHLEPGYWTFAE